MGGRGWLGRAAYDYDLVLDAMSGISRESIWDWRGWLLLDTHGALLLLWNFKISPTCMAITGMEKFCSITFLDANKPIVNAISLAR